MADGNSSDTRMICRAATFPFFPFDPDNWDTLRPILNHAWGLSTQLANWTISELYLADQLTVSRDGAKISAMPTFKTDGKPKDMYGLFLLTNPLAAQWQGAKREASTIIEAMKKKYAATRLDVIGRGFKSLPSFRFPYPFPISNQSWRPYYGKDNIPLVSAALPGGRVVLRLRGGPEMRRQLRYFAQMVGGAKRGEMAIYRRGKHTLCKLVGWFPLLKSNGNADKTIYVRTGADSLWIVESGGTVRRWNQEHMRQWCQRHHAWLLGVREDLKAEKRNPRSMQRHMLHAMRDRCGKQNFRLQSFCHDMTTELAEFARRQKATDLLYDDECKDWQALFPWHMLREMLTWKLEERGIKFAQGASMRPRP